jgi:hypothetical protein
MSVKGSCTTIAGTVPKKRHTFYYRVPSIINTGNVLLSSQFPPTLPAWLLLGDQTRPNTMHNIYNAFSLCKLQYATRYIWHSQDISLCEDTEVRNIKLILGKWPTWRTIIFYVFISILYMFQATFCSSSGESIVLIQSLVYVTLCQWPFRVQVGKEPTQSDIYERLYWYNWFSWWWALGCKKHVENWNKYLEKNCSSIWSFTKNRNEMHGLQNIYKYTFHVAAFRFLMWFKDKGKPPVYFPTAGKCEVVPVHSINVYTRGRATLIFNIVAC